jgi:8-oxo-dGTP diphosphatase
VHPASDPTDTGRRLQTAAPDWTAWVPQMHATLLFIFNGESVLLIRKKRGLGAGKINGPGGKIDPGETPAQCAVREGIEELGVRAENPVELGLLRFQFTDGLGILCHVFRADAFDGEPVETDEAIPLWTRLDAIPFDEMWADDRVWFPHLAARRKFVGNFRFDGDTMLACDLTVEA